MEQEIMAKIVLEDDGFHVVDNDGTMGPVCKYCDEGDKTIVLTPNAANRKWANRAKALEACEKDGFFPLTYKATRTIGSTGTRLPNEKLIAYLPEELQEEYKAIIARAIEARDAAKAKPLTEKEKLEKKIKKAQEALAKLMAAAENSEDAE